MAGSHVRWLSMFGGVLIAATFAASNAQAQGAYGYVFGAPGAVTCCGDSAGTFQVGGGGEYVTAIGVGVGAELSFLGPWEDLGQGFGVLSVNGSYHFGSAARRWRPFVTGGYTLFFRDGSANLWNIGGGVQYWFRDSLALRLEFRDQVRSEYDETGHFWGVRIGLSFGRR